MDNAHEIRISADLFKTPKGKAAFRYLQWMGKDLNVQPPRDHEIDPIAIYNSLRTLIDGDNEYRDTIRKAEDVLGISKIGITLEEIGKLNEEDYPVFDLESRQGLVIEVPKKTVDVAKATRPGETEFVIEEEPETKSCPPPTPQQNGKFTKESLSQNPSLAAKIRCKQPTSRHDCLQTQYHEMDPGRYDPCNRNICSYVHDDQRDYCDSPDYQRAVNLGKHKDWPPWNKIPYGKKPMLVLRNSTMDKRIDGLKRKPTEAGTGKVARSVKKQKPEEDEHEDLLNLPLNVLLQLSPEDMPMKVRRPDGHMVLTWSDKAIQKLKALRQEASRKEEDTADKKGETNNEEVAAHEEGTTEKRGAWIESEHDQIWKDK